MAAIYLIKNKLNGKVYVGQTTNVRVRKNRHFNDLRKGKHGNIHLQRAFNKYGEDAFEFRILENEVPENKLNELENGYMEATQCRKRDFGYNIEPGFSAGRRAEETKQKISKSKKGKLSGLNSHTKEANDKRSKSLLGKKKNIKLSKEEKSAIARANALKGVAKRRENSEYWSEYFRGKTRAWWANATREEKESRCLQMKEGWKNKKN